MINKMCMSVVKLLKGKPRTNVDQYQKVEVRDGWVTATDGYRLISISLPKDEQHAEPDLSMDILSARKLYRCDEDFLLESSQFLTQTVATAAGGDKYVVHLVEGYRIGFRAPLDRATVVGKTMKFNTRYLRELLSIIEQNAIDSVRIGFTDDMIVLKTEDETTKQQIQAVLMCRRD